MRCERRGGAARGSRRHHPRLGRRRCLQKLGALRGEIEGGRGDGPARLRRRQVAPELLGALVSLGRVFGERLHHDLVEHVGQAGHDLGRFRRHRVHVLHRHRHRAVALEGDLAREHLEEHDADRVEVRPLVYPLALGLFRRKVLCRAEDGARLRHALVAGVRDAEVGDLHGARVVDEDVLRLHVAVDHAVLVGVGECREQAQRDADRVVAAEPAAPPDELFEGLALDVLHHDEVGAVEGAPVEDGDEVGVAEACRRLRLAPEALDELGVPHVAGEQHLEGYAASQVQIFAEVDVGHPAAAQLAQHAVPLVDDLACLQDLTHSAALPSMVRLYYARRRHSCPLRAAWAAPGRSP